MNIPFATVDVFTDRRFGGNPLAVFHDAAELSDADMQSLAAEMNLSETTFVLPPRDSQNSAHVRIFNRTEEMDFAGHPNVGTAYALAQIKRVRGETLRFEERAGLVTVRLIREKRAVTGAEIGAPQPLSVRGEVRPDDIAECVGIRPEQIVRDHAPVRVSVGTEFVVCEVQAEALAAAAPNLSEFRRMIASSPDLNGRLAVLLYTRTAKGVRSRMFAPAAGTWEDPATGSAHAALAAFQLSLRKDQSLTQLAYEAVQGSEMGRPSRLHVCAWRAADGIRASVAGKCVPVFNGSVSL